VFGLRTEKKAISPASHCGKWSVALPSGGGKKEKKKGIGARVGYSWGGVGGRGKNQRNGDEHGGFE